MKYHFEVHNDPDGFWGECLELEGCLSQGDSLEELKANLKEALDLYLDEPDDSNLTFPSPKKMRPRKNVIEIEVDPQIALANLIRAERLKNELTQAQTAKKLGIPLYSYQRLEKSKTTNPEWKTLMKLCHLFPHLNLKMALS